MSNRWLRFGIALLAIGAASAAGYRIYQQQQDLALGIQRAGAIDASAEAALTTIPEIKAALHAYVAEGQGTAFWTARAAMLIDKLRAALVELDEGATTAGVPLNESLDLADRLSASERRARDHVRAGERLLAGEVIFTEARDVLDAMRIQLAGTRTRLAEASASTTTGIQRDQATLVASAGGILAFAVLLLVIAPAGATVAASTIKSAVTGPADEFESSARVVSRAPLKPTSPSTPPTGPGTPVRPVATTAATAVAKPQSQPKAASAPAGTNGNTNVVSPASAASPPATSGMPLPVSLREAAAICTELGRASKSIEVSNLLARAARVLDASGAIVWMTSSDGRELYPAASTGYDDRLLARIGAIPRSANNVTASAIRTGTSRTSPRAGEAAAALAIPLLTPLGAVGVLSAELKSAPDVDETCLAVATIFAAQLAGLVGARATAAAGATTAKVN